MFSLELTTGTIRTTEDGRVSVYDIIREVGGKKNPRDAWNAIAEQYTEVVGKTDSFKFPGKGQQFTPVASKKVTLEIIGLLPGVVGRTYREEAAKLVLEFIESPASLAEKAIDRVKDSSELKRIAARAEGKIVRNEFTSELAKRGVTGYGFAGNTNAIYLGVFGETAADLKDRLAVKNPRDGMTAVELAGVKLAELCAMERMEKKDARGNVETRKCSLKAGRIIGDALDKLR